MLQSRKRWDDDHRESVKSFPPLAGESFRGGGIWYIHVSTCTVLEKQGSKCKLYRYSLPKLGDPRLVALFRRRDRLV